MAQDVLALLRLERGRKVAVQEGLYFYGVAPSEGQLTSAALKNCTVCARDALFLASVDRFDSCDLAEIGSLNSEAQGRSVKDWGEQAYLIEAAFECYDDDDSADEIREFYEAHADPRKRLRAICLNIIKNGGKFKL